MRAYSFDCGWTCRHPEERGPGLPVQIPHDAMLAEPRSITAPSGANSGWYEGRDYLYEKKFIPDHELDKKTLILEFEGVYRNAEVVWNGKRLAFRPYGYTNFYVDVTKELLPDRENTLQVIARNADQPNSRWYSGAGIYRPVTLWVGPEKHILLNGIQVRTISIRPPAVEITVKSSTSGLLQLEILDGDRVCYATQQHTQGIAVFSVSLPEFLLWSPASPHLYTCRVYFGTDRAEAAFGIRSLSWSNRGLYLNEERVILQGACIHHDNGLLGACCHADAEERKIRLLKENGYNAVRSAHNPCSKALLDACDRLGMLVMDEYIDHWYIHKTEYDYVNYFDEWWKQDLYDMVEKDYNHPSVILYSTGNEVSETAQAKGIALTHEMTEFLHGLDSSRPVTCGVNIFFNFLSSIGFGVYSDKKARREAEKAAHTRQRTDQPQKKPAVGSQFFNDMAGLLGAGFMKWGATLPPCDWKTRDAFAEMDIAGYNYGIRRYRHDLQKYPDRLILGTETFCSDAWKFRELAKREPRLIGDFVWAGMDYLGEVGVGSWEYQEYAPNFSGFGWATAGSGRIDLTGKPLCEALYTRVALEQETGPYIGVCPVNHTKDKHSPSAWKMTNALASWSWPGWEGAPADVEIYARAASVELRINGQYVGKKFLRRDCIARFRCRYQPGIIEAIAYDPSGEKLGQYALHTAGPETELRAEPESPAVKKGHLCYIRLRYTDSQGILKPLERGIIQVAVNGGRLLGLGNACPYNPEGYLRTQTDTYYGEALAIVQASGHEQLAFHASDGRYTASATVLIEEE